MRRAMITAVTMLALLMGAGHASAASGKVIRLHKGLGPDVAVPAWAKHRPVHFMPIASQRQAIVRATARRSQQLNAEPRCATEHTCPPPPLHFRGGYVQHEPHLYAIFWGSNWTKGSGVELRTELLELYEYLSGSSYQGILTGYADNESHIGNSVQLTAYTDASVAAPENVNIGSIPTEVAAAIEENGWSREPDAQFVVLPAPGSTYGFIGPSCGFHTIDSHGSSNTFVPYEGDPPFSEGCLGYDPNRNAAHVTSMAAAHEYAESATDPGVETEPGWQTEPNKYGEIAEIADICTYGDVELEGGVFVQGLWDDFQGECSLGDNEVSDVLSPRTQAPVEVDAHGANLKGSIDPLGLDTHFYFEYDTDEYSQGEGAHGSKIPVPAEDAGSGWTDLNVSEQVSGLNANTTYHFRIVGETGERLEYGEDREFTTSTAKPTAVAAPATNVLRYSASLQASIRPNGLATTYQLEWADEDEHQEGVYNNAVPALPEGIGSGPGWIEVDQDIEGLRPGTQYFYRVSAENSDGATTSSASTFATEAVAGVVADEYPISIDGEATAFVLSAPGWQDSCGGATFDGSLEAAVNVLATSDAEVSSCGDPVDMNGCNYSFNPEGESHGTFGIGPAGCGPVEIEASGAPCVTVPSQGGFPMTYESGGSGGEETLTFTVDAEELKGSSCGVPFDDLGLDAQWVVSATDLLGDPTGIRVDDTLELPTGVSLVGEASAEGGPTEDEIANEPRIESELFPVTLSGGGFDEFTVTDGEGESASFECGSSGLSGQIAEAAKSVALDGSYGECTFLGIPSHVYMNGCHYMLEVSNAGPPYAGRWGVACEEEGEAIEYKVWILGKDRKCVKVYPQDGVEGLALSNTGKGAGRAIVASGEVKGLEYMMEGVCGQTATRSDGVMTGESRLTGR
jgi:hypothetical protein